ncbi:MAG: biotin--[acetyl-CoA-carboxylase] ligase, partial [Duncaniella sp.]|nr:biotin--[acetyl-CoA-carboxylase] ligase [Duncaniella sp.]
MFIIKDTLPSTSSYLAGIAADAPHGTVVMAREQTAGRGQRGNSWEAEPGCNITLSLLLRPEGLHPARQFVISQAVSLAIADLVSHFVAAPVSIKWPNDIYVDDRKICGILIENTITGTSIDRTIVGIGLNVNQTEFRSDAPNPVSMRQLMPKIEFAVASLARAMVSDL